jgi:N-acetylneuraminic acid mutarotase
MTAAAFHMSISYSHTNAQNVAGYVSVVHSNKLVLFGGFDGSRWLNDMYVFDFETKTWNEIQARGVLPSVRSCPAWAKDGE